MIRNLKTLGLALTAVLALGAVLASGASAQQGELTIEGGWANLTGHEIEAGSESVEAFGDSVRCPGSTYTGYEYGLAPQEPVPSGATTATIVPDYEEEESNCRSAANFPVTISMNGCDYVLHVGETTPGEEHVYQATFDIVCPSEEDIEIHFYLGTSHGFEVCHLTVTPATGLIGADIVHNTAGDDIELRGTVEGIVTHRSGLCVEGEVFTDYNARINLNSTITGHRFGTDRAVTVTDVE